MSPITFEDQSETLNPSAPGCQYRQRLTFWICFCIASWHAAIS